MRTIITTTALLLFSLFTFGQLTVKGVITDSNNETLIGVNIVEKGTTNGTISDLDGKFQITVANNAKLIFTYIGYEVVEQPVDTIVNVVLEELGLLDEVVVSALKLERNSREVVYANQTISAVRGKTAGVKVSKKRKGNSGSGYLDFSTPTIPLQGKPYDAIQENKFISTQDEPLSTFSIDVDRASYTNIRNYITNGQIPPKDAIRIEEMINYFDYSFPEPSRNEVIKINGSSTICPWNSKNQLVMVNLQGKSILKEELPPSNLVFLIDVSGSMMSANKLPLLQQSFRFLIDELDEDDRVSIVTYAGHSGVLLSATSGADKITIKKAIDQLSAGGSTAGSEGIKTAYQEAEANFINDGNNRVILATDGDFNVGISGDKELVKLIEEKRESGVFLTVVGVGSYNYAESKMQKLAQSGNGNHVYFDNISEAQKVFQTEFTATTHAIAKDVKLQIEFNPNHVSSYRLIGYVNRLLETEDFEDDKKDAGEMGAGHTVTAIYEVTPAKSDKSTVKQSDLKYSITTMTLIESLNNELATVKLRYKQPDEKKSQEMSHIVHRNDAISSDENFSWANLVAEFGMYLSESEYLPKKYDYNEFIEKAKATLHKIKKPSKEQIEFVDLVKEVGKLQNTSMVK